MDIGSSLISLGLDLNLLQGFLNQTYAETEDMQRIAGLGFDLELELPRLETRGDQNDYRLGLHLRGLLRVEGSAPMAFDAWVVLDPVAELDASGIPVGKLRYRQIEEVLPDLARSPLEHACAPGGRIGDFIGSSLKLPLFEILLREVAHSGLVGRFGSYAEMAQEVSWSFYLGRPGTISRPHYRTPATGYKQFSLKFEGVTEKVTVPALIASVALPGQEAELPDRVSTVPHATGIQLITSKALMDANLAQKAKARIGTKIADDVEIKSLSLTSTDAGIAIDLHGEKHSGSLDIQGTIAAQFYGEIGGTLVMVPAIQVDVEMAPWVEALSFLCAALPLVGWVIGDILIWEPFEDVQESAPIDSGETLARDFNETLRPIAEQVATSFQIEGVESRAYLADVWFFDGNFAVSAAAFAGLWHAQILETTYDVAHVGRQGHLKPVTSVADLLLDSGQRLKPWHAGELAKLGILKIPHHHGVKNHLARGGFYLRSNPNATTTDNLIPEPALT